MVKSLRGSPASFSSEVTKWLHQTVRLPLSPLISVVHAAQLPFSKGMHLSHDSAQTGLPPLLALTPELVNEYSLVTSFTTNAMTEFFQIGALRDTWTWRDLSTSEPLLVPLDESVQCLQEIHLNRARRLDPPI